MNPNKVITTQKQNSADNFLSLSLSLSLCLAIC